MDETDERELIERLLGGGAAGARRRGVATLAVHLPHGVEESRRLVINVLRIEGREALDVLDGEIGAVVGGGIAGPRATVVSVKVRQAADGTGSDVTIRCAATQGLSRQRAGRTAVEMVADRLRLVSGLPQDPRP